MCSFEDGCNLVFSVLVSNKCRKSNSEPWLKTCEVRNPTKGKVLSLPLHSELVSHEFPQLSLIPMIMYSPSIRGRKTHRNKDAGNFSLESVIAIRNEGQWKCVHNKVIVQPCPTKALSSAAASMRISHPRIMHGSICTCHRNGFVNFSEVSERIFSNF